MQAKHNSSPGSTKTGLFLSSSKLCLGSSASLLGSVLPFLLLLTAILGLCFNTSLSYKAVLGFGLFFNLKRNEFTTLNLALANNTELLTNLLRKQNLLHGLILYAAYVFFYTVKIVCYLTFFQCTSLLLRSHRKLSRLFAQQTQMCSNRKLNRVFTQQTQ